MVCQGTARKVTLSQHCKGLVTYSEKQLAFATAATADTRPEAKVRYYYYYYSRRGLWI